ncbi:MAG: FixH family protein [Pseudomonadota bacterium]
MKELTGRHVFAIFALGFGTIITVNMTLAYSAVATFPGLEVKNSYVASQSFDRDRAAQLALGWDVAARLQGEKLVLSITRDGGPVVPEIEAAVFGRATSVKADQEPQFSFDGQNFVAPVEAGAGNWNLRLTLRAPDGTRFQQRVIVEAGA